MTRFVEVTDVLAGKKLINLDHVAAIVPPGNVNDSCQLFLTTGEMHIVVESYEQIKSRLAWAKIAPIHDEV